MTLAELLDFIESKMDMRHVYQPVLIRTLVDAGGAATLRQLAQAFLLQDEAELQKYEQVIRRMPLDVLKRRGVVVRDGDLVRLCAPQLKLQDRARVRAACEQRLQDYVADRGEDIWDYKRRAPPAPGSLRYRVIQAADHRCAACGITDKERPLDVDHIIPRSRGGKTVIENLQALCAACNRAKGNRDTTDFRVVPTESVAGCPYCDNAIATHAIAENGTVFAIREPPHDGAVEMVIVTHRHAPDWFSTSELERQHADELMRVLRGRLAREGFSVLGFSSRASASPSRRPAHAHLRLVVDAAAER